LAVAQPAPDGSGPLVKVGVIADTDGIVAGRPFVVGVVLEIKPGWHVYWSNPGDSGLPTQIDWKLPAGFVVGSTRYPLPLTFTQAGDVVGYGYEGRVMLTNVVTPASDLKPGTTSDLTVSVKWLVCESVCIPGKTKLTLSLPVVTSATPTNTEAFMSATAQLPQGSEASGLHVLSAVFEPATSVATVKARFEPAERVKAVEFYPGPSDAVEIRHAQIELAADTVVLRLPVKIESTSNLPTNASGLVVWTNDAGERKGATIEVPTK